MKTAAIFPGKYIQGDGVLGEIGAIIAASMGSTLTVRKESKIKELDIN